MNSGATTVETKPEAALARRAPVEPLAPGDAPRGKARHLIPLSQPQPGEQFAFTVDLDRCSGCKACVSACHSLNGLDDHETWRDVGLLIGVSEAREHSGTALLQTITSACHHCLDPACANGCPVLAYDKDPVTGIVRHLDDQCIGCQYCVLKCPYDVPKYSEARGIVRKCDMCHQRLAAGEAPACVQACPHEAIRIDLVDTSEVRAARSAKEDTLIPGVFPSPYTLPTTRYESSRPLPTSARPANADSLCVEHAHAPLAWMLVLTQGGAGLHVMLALLLARQPNASMTILTWGGWGLLISGLLVGFAHLGRPLKAWRAFLGWRKSWMSREILLFSAYAQLATLLLLLPASKALAGLTAAMGLLAVFTSAMIYIDTRRPSWSPGVVLTRFGFTMLVLGVTGALVENAFRSPGDAPSWTWAALGTGLLAGLAEGIPLWRARNRPAARLHGMAGRWFGPLRGLWWSRTACWATALALLASGLMFDSMAGPTAVLAWVALFGGYIMERYGFFMACPSPRMPGGVVA